MFQTTRASPPRGETLPATDAPPAHSGSRRFLVVSLLATVAACVIATGKTTTFAVVMDTPVLRCVQHGDHCEEATVDRARDLAFLRGDVSQSGGHDPSVACPRTGNQQSKHDQDHETSQLDPAVRQQCAVCAARPDPTAAVPSRS